MPGLAEMLSGWTQDPKARTFFGNALTDLGYGLTNAPDFGSALGAATRRTSELSGVRLAQEEKSKADQLAAQQMGMTAERLRALSGGNILADAVQSGGLAPSDAWQTYFRDHSAAAKQAEIDARNRGNSMFLKDPALREMVATGALDFSEAYRIERGGAGGNGNLGTTIYTGRDAQGNIVPMQVGQDGFVPSRLPEGVTFDPGAMSGARAGATYDAKTTSAAKAAMPSAEEGVRLTLRAGRLLRDPQGLDEWFGQFGPRGMYIHPGTAMGNWKPALDQAMGQAFMQARQALKGGGQITDYEGRRAEAAFARMETAARTGDKASFLTALDDFETSVQEGYRRLLEVSQGSYSPSQNPASTDYRTLYGLD